MEKAIILTSNIAKKKTSVAGQFCFVIWICNDSPYFQLYCQPFFPLSSLFFSLSSDAHFQFKPLWVPCTFGLFTGSLYRLRRPEKLHRAQCTLLFVYRAATAFSYKWTFICLWSNVLSLLALSPVFVTWWSIYRTEKPFSTSRKQMQDLVVRRGILCPLCSSRLPHQVRHWKLAAGAACHDA